MHAPQPTATPQKSRLHVRRRFLIGCMIALCIVAFFILLGLWRWTYLSRPAFQIYEPTALPTGVYIDSRNYYLYPHGRGTLWITLSKANLQIGETGADRSKGKADTCRPMAANIVCRALATPDRHKYFISTTTKTNDSGAIQTDQTISFNVGDTMIWIPLNNDRAQAYANIDWGKFIDSFQPKNPKNIHAERVNGF
jgi:hypothetical protein